MNPPITIAQTQMPPVMIYQNQMPLLTIAQTQAPMVIIQGGNVMVSILPFSMVAIVDQQTVFVLPYTFTTIICLYIMGVGQNILNGDYTLNGNQITFSQGVALGYVVFGAGQI